ncbi:MAG: XdhC family protein [Granulosicoccaceae bacterium]
MLTVLGHWLDEGHTADLVTVVSTFGSSPRPLGSIAAVRDDGKLVGSVSGGCVEQNLVEHFSRSKKQHQKLFEIEDKAAREFGLPCGGKLELLFERIDDAAQIHLVLELLDRRQLVKRVVHTEGSQPTIIVEADANSAFSYDDNRVTQVFGPGWRVLLVGAGELSFYTAQFAQTLDFDVRVIDPRPKIRGSWQLDSITVEDLLPDEAVSLFANDERSAVMALSHDAELDDLALQEALPSSAFYVGALGSRGNNKKRLARLAHFGLVDDELARLHGPIGLSIDSRTSAEIAISIMAQVIAERAKVRNG